MRLRLLGVGLFAALSIATSACDEPLSDITGPTPNLETTFSSIQRDIFNADDSSGRRACTNCHNATGQVFAGRLDLSGANAYGNLVDVNSFQRPALKRVAPGDPENSYLIHKLEGRPTILGQRMPLNSPSYLTPGQILVIARWITEGAQNN